jgi:hypothetical protein
MNTLAERLGELSARVRQTEDAIDAALAQHPRQLQAQRDPNAAERRAEHDHKHAQRRADEAGPDALIAIRFPMFALEQPISPSSRQPSPRRRRRHRSAHVTARRGGSRR